MESIKNKIEDLLNKELKGFHIEVWIGKHFYGGNYVGINIATSNYEINRVEGQYYNNISLILDDDLTLKFQSFGGNGGQRIYRKINNTPNEKYLALGHEKIQFRTPKKDEKSVINAIKKVCDKYKDTLRLIDSQNLLREVDLNKVKSLIY